MNKQETIEALQKIRAVIEKPENWTQDRDMRTSKDGIVSYCLIGAMKKAMGNAVVGSVGSPIWTILTDVTGGISYFNDHSTHSEVLSLIDRTIEGVENGSIAI